MELLSPAGNAINLIAAVSGGADAVYLGLDKLNARAKADNFDAETLCEAVRYCHLHGVKVHVALNTIIKNSEIDTVCELLETIGKSRADAVIIQDLPVLHLAKTILRDAELHASTQIGIHNRLGAEFAAAQGFTRVVLARETTLQDIADIKKNVDIEIECFCHGALCVAFSGNCYMSSQATGNSGNRGRCLQLCRKRYDSRFGDGYLLSTKDLCLINRISELKDVGVDSLKIEGRLKSRAYVYHITKMYRDAIDGKKIDFGAQYAAKVAFNRGGFTEGYAFGDTGDIIYKEIQSNIGFKAAHIISSEPYYKEFLLKPDNLSMLNEGQGIKIIDNGIEQGGFKLRMHNGSIIADKPYRGDIHITSDERLDSFEESKIPLKLELRAVIGEPLKLTVIKDDIIIEKTSDYIVEKAQNRANTNEEILRQITKLGNTEFVAHAEIIKDNQIYIPNKVLADLRREAVAEIENKILLEFENTRRAFKYNTGKFEKTAVSLDSDIIIETDRYHCAISDKIIVTKLTNYSEIRSKLSKNKTIYLKLPIFLSGESISRINSIIDEIIKAEESIGIFADNYAHVQLAIERSLPYIAGPGLNISNETAMSAHTQASGVIQSIELSSAESLKGAFSYIFGYVPVMTLRHCPLKNLGDSDCAHCDFESFAYKTEYGNFKVVREKIAECVFTVYNTACRNTIGMVKGRAFSDITGLDDITAERVIRAVERSEKISFNNSTKGSLTKGVL